MPSAPQPSLRDISCVHQAVSEVEEAHADRLALQVGGRLDRRIGLDRERDLRRRAHDRGDRELRRALRRQLHLRAGAEHELDRARGQRLVRRPAAAERQAFDADPVRRIDAGRHADLGKGEDEAGGGGLPTRTVSAADAEE